MKDSPTGAPGAQFNWASMPGLQRLFNALVWILLGFAGICACVARPGLVLSTPFVGGYILISAITMFVAHSRLLGMRYRARLAVVSVLTASLVAVAIAFGGSALNMLFSTYSLIIILVGGILSTRFAALFLVYSTAIATAVLWFNANPNAGSAVVISAASVAVLLGSSAILSRLLFSSINRERQFLIDAADRDALTSLYNLARFSQVADRHHARVASRKEPYGILMVDVDDLKSINARYGLDVGNRAIALVARILHRLVVEEDVVARFSAGKFVILARRIEHGRLEDLARRIKNVVYATTMSVGTAMVRIKANVGVAKYPLNGDSVEAMLQYAESAMQQDRSGRDTPKRKPVFVRRSGTRKS